MFDLAEDGDTYKHVLRWHGVKACRRGKSFDVDIYSVPNLLFVLVDRQQF